MNASTYWLYYAGMAQDQINEQIGLAVSDDGRRFQRVLSDGLIIPRDPKLAWKDLRVCNPTVLFDNGSFVMFYQGVSSLGAKNTVLGLARSADGVRWTCDEHPFLSVTDMEKVDGRMVRDARVALIEPAVLKEGGLWRLWFVYMNPSFPGNALFLAESEDARHWTIDPRPVAIGSAYGNCNLHYPQIVKRDGAFELWLTLRNNAVGAHAIVRLHSADGRSWHSLQQILPASASGLALQNKEWFGVRWQGRKVPGVGFLNYQLARALPGGQRNFFGYAHPHRLDDEEALYYHNCNTGPRGLWHAISRGVIREGALKDDQTVLAPGEGRGAWDSFFVADPFVLKTPRVPVG